MGRHKLKFDEVNIEDYNRANASVDTEQGLVQKISTAIADERMSAKIDVENRLRSVLFSTKMERF